MNFFTTRIKAAIFDMDGTMFDTERLRMKMIKEASGLIYGEEMSDELLIESLGVNAKTAESLAKDYYNDDYPYKEIREKADVLETQYVRKHGVPVKEGLYDVLERLKKNEVIIALATSSKRSIATEYLLSADVLQFFDIIVCGDEVENGKPDPEIYLKTASEINCDLSNCLIFEDSENGLLSASRAEGIPIFIKDIKEPKDEIKALVYKSYENMICFLDDLVDFTAKMPVPKLNEHFPQSFGYIRVGIHGFGSIGGGYLAQIFSHWDGYTRPAEIVGTTQDEILLKMINAFSKYDVKYQSLAYNQTISNVRLIDAKNQEDVINMYVNSHIVGLSLPEVAIKSEADVIANGLIARYESGASNLTILIIMNKIKAARFVKRNVENSLKIKVGLEKTKEIIGKTYFCETVVNRMVSTVSTESILDEFQTNILQLNRSLSTMPNIQTVFDYYTKNKRKKSLKKFITNHDIDEYSEKLKIILQYHQEFSKFKMTLFNSEPDMVLYVDNTSPLVKRMRQVETTDSIGKMQEIKNKLSNGTHAIIAWYSSILGYQTIGQGMGDPKVLNLVKLIMKKEIMPALINENPEFEKYINGFIESFIKRCRASFKDKCKRVGRDPMRKLEKGERVFGTIELAKKYNIPTPKLEFGVVCALKYAILNLNPNDKDSCAIKNLYDKTHSVKDVLLFNGDYNGRKYKGLDAVEDAELISRIEKQFENFKE